MAATDVIVPIDVGFFSLTGLSRMVKIIEQVQHAYNPELQILGVLATKYDSRTTLSDNTIKAIEGKKVTAVQNKNSYLSRYHSCPDGTVARESLCN